MQVDGEGQPNGAVDEAAVSSIEASLDDLELNRAREAAQAEEAGNAGAGETEIDQQPENGNGADGKPQGTQPAGMIPKQRFDEVNHARRHYETEAQRLARVNADLVRQLAEAKGPVIPIEQRRSEIEAKIDALAEQFDAGQLTAKEQTQQTRVHQRELDALREEEFLARVPKSEPAQAERRETLALDEATAKLEQDHPYVQHLSVDQLKMIAPQAIAALGDGFVNDGSERASLMLRTKIAEMSDDYGPVMLKGNDPVLAARQSGAAGGAPGTKPLTPAQQQRKDKGMLAAGMPPAVDSMTSGGGGTGELTEDAIAAMTTEELEALPIATLRRFTGG